MVFGESRQTIERRFLAMLRGRPDAMGSKQVFLGLLKGHFPQERTMVQLMAVLYDMGAHKEIESAGRVTKGLAQRFAKRLVDERGIDREDAEGAIHLLCACYAEVLGKPCDLAKAAGGGKIGAPSQPVAQNNAQRTATPRPKRGWLDWLFVALVVLGMGRPRRRRRWWLGTGMGRPRRRRRWWY